MWDLDGKTAAHLTNYEPFVASIATHTTAFGKPVLLFDGDSHVYRSDNPLVQARAVHRRRRGVRLRRLAEPPVATTCPNFHRVIVHGSTFPLEWLKLTVDPSAQNPTTATSFGPFTWQRMPQP